VLAFPVSYASRIITGQLNAVNWGLSRAILYSMAWGGEVMDQGERHAMHTDAMGVILQGFKLMCRSFSSQNVMYYDLE
jgi:hypothetical protein